MPESQINDPLKEFIPDVKIDTSGILSSLFEGLGYILHIIISMIGAIFRKTIELFPKIRRGHL